MVVKENIWLVDICRMVHAAVPLEYKDDIQTEEMSRWPIYIAALFSSEANYALTRWGHNIAYDNSKSKRILGLRYETEAATSVGRTATTLIERGAISFLC